VLCPKAKTFRLQLLADREVPRQLLVGKERVRIVGGREVGEEAVQLEAGQVAQRVDNRPRLVRRGAVAGHARVNLDLDAQHRAGSASRLGQALGGGPVGDGRRQVELDDLLALVGRGATHQQDRRMDESTLA
jgi:hypothetical protein